MTSRSASARSSGKPHGFTTMTSGTKLSQRLRFHRGRRLSRRGAHRDAAGERNELRHPGAAEHQRLDPLERDDARAGGGPFGAARDCANALAQSRTSGRPLHHASDRRRHAIDVSENIFEAGWPKADDANPFSMAESRDGCLNVIEGDCTDFTQVLGDDDVRLERAEPLLVDGVDAERVANDRADSGIDRAARVVQVDPRPREYGPISNRFWEVTLVRDADQALAGPQRADDLRRRGQERDDPRSEHSPAGDRIGRHTTAKSLVGTGTQSGRASRRAATGR